MFLYERKFDDAQSVACDPRNWWESFMMDTGWWLSRMLDQPLMLALSLAVIALLVLHLSRFVAKDRAQFILTLSVTTGLAAGFAHFALATYPKFDRALLLALSTALAVSSVLIFQFRRT